MQMNIAFADAPTIPEDIEEKAYRFLKRYAKAHKTAPWSPEAAVEAAARKGIFFAEQRNWGRIFTRVQGDGLIKPAGTFPRRTSNNSRRPGWIGV